MGRRNEQINRQRRGKEGSVGGMRVDVSFGNKPNLDSRRSASKSSNFPASDPFAFALSHRRLTRCEINRADVRPCRSYLRLRLCVPPRQ